MKSIQEIILEFKKYTTIKYDIPYHWFEIFLLQVIQKDKVFLMINQDYVLSTKEYDDYQTGITKMQQGMPLAYIIGETDFWGRTFRVNEHTLIPRPDTEILIETVLDFIDTNQVQTGNILDLGTGSGCIAITLAKELPKFNILAVDNSTQALKIAEQNADELGAKNCRFLWSEWFSNVDNTNFDVIVSNPPYIVPNDIHLSQLTYEPITALVGGGNDGLYDIRTIIKHSRGYLTHQGLLVIEHGYHQADLVQNIFREYDYKGIKTIKDYGHNDRVTLGIFE